MISLLVLECIRVRSKNLRESLNLREKRGLKCMCLPPLQFYYFCFSPPLSPFPTLFLSLLSQCDVIMKCVHGSRMYESFLPKLKSYLSKKVSHYGACFECVHVLLTTSPIFMIISSVICLNVYHALDI